MQNNAARERSKRLLVQDEETGEQDFLRFQARCTRRFGPAAGVFLRQLVFWIGKEHDPDGWIYKTEKEMEDETGLTRHHQRKARKILIAAGVLEEVRRSIPRKLYYRVDLQKLTGALYATSNANVEVQSPSGTYSCPTAEEAIVASQEGEINEADKADAYTDPATTESTSETTPEVSTESWSTDPENRAAHDSSPGKLATEGIERTASPPGRESDGSSGEDRSRSGQYQPSAPPSPVHATHRGLLSRLDGGTKSARRSIKHRELREEIHRLLGRTDPDVYWALVSHWEDEADFSDLAATLCRAVTGSLDEVENYTDHTRRWIEYLTPRVTWQRKGVLEWTA